MMKLKKKKKKKKSEHDRIAKKYKKKGTYKDAPDADEAWWMNGYGSALPSKNNDSSASTSGISKRYPKQFKKKGG